MLYQKILLIQLKFLIHCETGLSRSAGVALAVEKLVGNIENIEKIKSHKRYRPNMKVFHSITD